MRLVVVQGTSVRNTVAKTGNLMHCPSLYTFGHFPRAEQKDVENGVFGSSPSFHALKENY